MMDRPSTFEIELAMTCEDWRPALVLARDLGLWLGCCGEEQQGALNFLLTEPITTVKAATAAVIDRFEAPTPQMVAQQLFCPEGAASASKPYPWANPGNACQGAGKKRQFKAKPTTSSAKGNSSSTTTKTWRKRVVRKRWGSK